MARKNRVILIVDDDEDMRAYLSKILENQGHEVHEAENLTEAMTIVTHVIPHLVFLDINLENENGFNLIGQIRKFDPYKRIKTVMISSSSSKQAIEMSKKLDTDGYLIKPINNSTLVTLMKKITPTLVFTNAKNIDEKYSLLMSKCLGQITKINETSLVLRSKVKFKMKNKLQVDSLFLNKLDLENAQLIVQGESQDVHPGTYDTVIQFVGLKESDLKQIRALKTKKA